MSGTWQAAGTGRHWLANEPPRAVVSRAQRDQPSGSLWGSPRRTAGRCPSRLGQGFGIMTGEAWRGAQDWHPAGLLTGTSSVGYVPARSLALWRSEVCAYGQTCHEEGYHGCSRAHHGPWGRQEPPVPGTVQPWPEGWDGVGGPALTWTGARL